MDTSVDPQALQAAARRLDAVVDLLHGALNYHLRALRFDRDAGVCTAIDQLVGGVAQWRRAAGDTASALRLSAAYFVDTETRSAQALR